MRKVGRKGLKVMRTKKWGEGGVFILHMEFLMNECGGSEEVQRPT